MAFHHFHQTDDKKTAKKKSLEARSASKTNAKAPRRPNLVNSIKSTFTEVVWADLERG